MTKQRKPITDTYTSISHWGMFPVKLEPYPFPQPNPATIKTLVGRYRYRPLPTDLTVWGIRV